MNLKRLPQSSLVIIIGVILLLTCSCQQPDLRAGHLTPTSPPLVGIFETESEQSDFDHSPTVTSQAATTTLTLSFTEEVLPSPTATITTTPSVDPYAEHPLPTLTPTTTPTIAYPPGVNPLTGLAVDSPDILNRKPVFIKVSNYPPYGRPHAGLSDADLVFEYYIGEGLNRFMAVYYGKNSPKVGPIRSGRLVDAQLVEMYQGFLVFGGADDRVEMVINSILGARSIDITDDHPCPPICGTDTHSPVGVFVDSGQISEYVNSKVLDNTKPVLNGMAFQEPPPSGEQNALKIGVQFSKFCRGEWIYDPQKHTYLRWIEQDLDITIMVPLVDRNTDEQLSFDNVLILFTDYIIYTPTLHDIEIWQNTTGKRAVLFRDGLKLEGKWKTNGDKQPIQLLDGEDHPLYLKPGKTWIIVTSTQSTIESPVDGTWEMRFALP